MLSLLSLVLNASSISESSLNPHGVMYLLPVVISYFGLRGHTSVGNTTVHVI
jgi:hypothetical protein